MVRIDAGRVTWRVDRAVPDGGEWETVRQDDNGDAFVLDRVADAAPTADR